MAVTFLTNEDKAILDQDIAQLTEEITEESVPLVFYGKPLPQTKDAVVMPIRIVIGNRTIDGYCETKAQGSSSMGYPKKNQTTKLYKDAACTQKLKIAFRNWGEQYKFCLKANWIDFTHARNIVTARLWGDVVRSRPNFNELPELLRTSPNCGAIDGFPVLVWADGVYQGRYTLNIPKDAWMANMDDDLDTHSILCGETNGGGAPAFRAETIAEGGTWKDEIHDVMPTPVLNCLNGAIRFVMNSTDEEFIAGLDNHIDKYSAFDYDLLALYDCGIDGMGKNQILLTYDAVKLIASAYDLDSTWRLWWDASKLLPWDYPRTGYEDMIDGRPGNLLYQRIESLMVDELIERWEALKAGPLSVANVMMRFEEFMNIVSPEIMAEDYALTTEYGAFDEMPLVRENTIQQIREFVEKRVAWVDNYLADLKTAKADTPVMAEKATWWNGDAAGVEQDTITHIHFDADYEVTGNEDASWACDVGAAGNIMAYRTGTVITIKPITARRLRLNKSSEDMFSNNEAKGTKFSAVRVIAGTEMWLADANTIMDRVCRGNANLLYPVCIPEGVQYAGGAFDTCSSLRYAPELPSTLLTINMMFNGCENLRVLPEIPAGCVAMNYAFQFCLRAKKAPSVIPAGMKQMDRAFYRCDNLNGNIEVNAATLNQYVECFTNACSVSGAIILSGTSPHLEDLAATNTQGKVTVAS